MNNLVKRILTAFFAVPVVVFSIWYNEWTYLALFFIIGGLTMYEYMTLLQQKGIILPTKVIGLGSALIYFYSFFYKKSFVSLSYIYVLYFSAFMVYIACLYQAKNKNSFESMVYSLSCLLYIAFPFSSLHLSAFTSVGYSYQIVLGYLLMLWMNDSSAFFFGKMFGKHKLFYRISPKKTWEGAVLGVIFTVMGSFFIGKKYLGILSPNQWAIIALIVSIVSTYGDLLESLLKRELQIKDSGSIIPGHGGFMDRFDGFLLTSPLLGILLYFFRLNLLS